ncbi:uncharacterized protein BYT42DRAFT_523618 [Radiomyces spectabilis]|uniref:uncharacterized protein n=1 Tax=Radiomyces spectabilis TaxID=64574 RepID=UPI00221F5E42|nr:uncharacterized protein BYT42DRAFT_523618 [Radiomyces spectabilis]KAI8365275.1 hypothetical protein BYT42DRAFT_523618 [Radiomyces spectabilis]
MDHHPSSVHTIPRDCEMQSSSWSSRSNRRMNRGSIAYDGGPIPDVVRDSYTMQRLPVRKQSLAAYRDHGVAVPTASSVDSLSLASPTSLSSSPKSAKSMFASSSLQKAARSALKLARHSRIDPTPRHRDDLTSSPPEIHVSLDEESSPTDTVMASPLEMENELDGPRFTASCDGSKKDKNGDAEGIWEMEEEPVQRRSRRSKHRGTAEMRPSKSESSLHVHAIRTDSLVRDSDHHASSDELLSPSSLTKLRHVLFPLLHLQRDEKSVRMKSPALIYPALLSCVAAELHRCLITGTMTKNDIMYRDVFTGEQAVDCLLPIIRSRDRNLALLVGRALDRQGFLHDVNYEHRLRDSAHELYPDRSDMNGVFTVLTECYAPTCTRNTPCYSVHCPRALKKDLCRAESQSSLPEKKEPDLWMHSVPKEIVEATDPRERKRQECIFELIYTEQNFVEDLHYLHENWVKPLITSDIIPEERRELFVQEVFWNVSDIAKVNGALLEALTKRQTEQPVINGVGDIMVKYAHQFGPFVAYGAHQAIGKFMFELERKKNPRFAQFIQDTEHRPEARRLELNGYLTKPTSRLGRYNLLLREIYHRTTKPSNDAEKLQQAMQIITHFLNQLNTEVGRSENMFNLQQIAERIYFTCAEHDVNLRLFEPERRLIMQGRMKRKDSSLSEASEAQVFLFDHYVVFAKIRYFDHLERYKVYRKPIPLQDLSVSAPPSKAMRKRRASLLSYSKIGSASLTPLSGIAGGVEEASHQVNETAGSLSSPISGIGGGGGGGGGSSSGHAITFYHHGRGGSSPITLYVASETTRRSWISKINEQKQLLLSNGSISSSNSRTLSTTL